jgi:putative ABC transport system permease protein
MRFTKIARSSLRLMARHKLRSFLTMLGIVAGVMTLTLVSAIGAGTEARVLRMVAKLFDPSNILVTAGGGRLKGTPLPFGPNTTLTIADIEDLQREIPDITAFDPMQLVPDREVKHAGRSAFTRVLGGSERNERVWHRGAVRGETIDAAAVQSAARVAVVGQTLAGELFGEEDPVGREVDIAGIPFRVIGVLEALGTDPHGLDRDHEILVPITTLMRRVLNVDYISGAKLVVRDPALVEATAERVRAILRERHHLGAAEEDDFQIVTPTKVRQVVAGMNRLFNVFLPLLAVCLMTVAGVIVANLMLVSVEERTAEIGLRRAVGARSRDIFRQFAMEATLLTLAGGVAGALLGVAAAQVVARAISLPPIVPTAMLSAGVVLSGFIGLVAGLLPARRAARLDPVQALR